VLQDLVRDLVRSKQSFENIIDFIESPLGVNLILFPIQKFAIKIINGIPLCNDVYIDVYDELRKKCLYRLSEVDYLKFLYEQDRCNHKDDPQMGFKEVIWRGGRRGVKSSSHSLIGAYELYRILQMEDPHAYYNLLPSADIRFANVANTRKQNEVFYESFKTLVRSKDFYKKHLYPSKSDVGAKFYTKRELSQKEQGHPIVPSVKLDSITCNSASARGGNNIYIFLDEFAHFSKILRSTRSDVEIYDALTPSIGSFGNDGRIFIFSSPLGPSGKMFELSEKARTDKKLLVLELPSWEINPTLTTDFLEARFKRSRASFMREYGAKYVSATSEFIEDESLLDIAKKDFSTVYTYPKKSYHFYYGVDLGFVKDKTGIAIAHTQDNKVYVDHCEGIGAGFGQYENIHVLDHDIVIDRLKRLFLEFPPFKGTYDRWEGYGLDNSMRKAGIHNFEQMSASDAMGSQMYKIFYALLVSNTLFFNNQLKSLFDELLTLQKEVKNKFIIKVHAPQVSSMHDDMSDATARAIYLAYQYGVLQSTPAARVVSSRDENTRKLANYYRRVHSGRL